jgi:hypothetical protein
MPCPSHSWYRLSHLLKTHHWAPDCSCNCCYTKFQSENKGLRKEIFRSECKLPLMWCQSYLIRSKRIHSQFQTITKYRTSYFIFQWIQNTNGCSQNMVDVTFTVLNTCISSLDDVSCMTLFMAFPVFTCSWRLLRPFWCTQFLAHSRAITLKAII